MATVKAKMIKAIKGTSPNRLRNSLFARRDTLRLHCHTAFHMVSALLLSDQHACQTEVEQAKAHQCGVHRQEAAKTQAFGEGPQADQLKPGCRKALADPQGRAGQG